MSNYSTMLREEDHGYQSSVLRIYNGNRDLRLLLDFFCISSGVAPSLAILAAVDQVEIINDRAVSFLPRHIIELLVGLKTLYSAYFSVRGSYQA